MCYAPVDGQAFVFEIKFPPSDRVQLHICDSMLIISIVEVTRVF